MWAFEAQSCWILSKESCRRHLRIVPPRRSWVIYPVTPFPFLTVDGEILKTEKYRDEGRTATKLQVNSEVGQGTVGQGVNSLC